MLHATRIDRPAHERMRVAAPTQAVPPQRERRHVATPLRPSQAPLAQRKCACGGLGGECASCRRERLQTCRQKLGGQPARSWAISPAQDAYEQEADRVAEQVLAMDPQKTADVPGSAVPHKTEGVTPALRAPAAVREVLQSEGQPLAPEARAFLEPRFGNDFGHVRVHTGSRAAESARQINALAYTVSNHVVFGAGRYEPGTSTGRRLLAHELTHVLQQEAGTRATHAQKAEDPTAEGGEYGVDDAIARLELALSTADAALADPTLDPGKRSLIERQVERLTPLLDQLPDARGTEGEDIVFDFDPDLRENEINPGDADRSIAELFAESPEEAPEEVPETDEGSGGPDFLQATAQPGGLRVTPLASPVVQRDGGLTVIIIIALAGLLLAGCKDSSSSSQPTPSQPPPPPTPPPQPPAPPTAAPATPTQADRFTYGEIRQWAVTSVSHFTPPAGLADAKASIAAACALGGGRCNNVDGSTATAPADQHAWANILAASGGTDRSNGGSLMCVGTEECGFVHQCKRCRGGTPVTVERATNLTATGTCSVGGHTLYFYSDPLQSWCNAADRRTACRS